MRDNLKILIVDDEVRFLTLTSKMLNIIGYLTETCTRGALAIEEITKNPHKFDLVLLDIIMPELNGTETYLKIKNIAPSLPVVFTSGYSLEESFKQLEKTGAKGYLKKPFSQKELTDLLKKIF